MQLNILGYWGGFPLNGGASSSYLITTNQGRVLFDVGSASASKYSEIGTYDQLSAIFLSHLHNDHMADLKTYEHAWNVMYLRMQRVDHKLPVYLPTEPASEWERLTLEVLDLHDLEAQPTYEVAGLQIAPFPVQHSIPCFGFRIQAGDKVIAYTADTAYFPELITYVKNADILITDTTTVPGSMHSGGKGHMSVQEAATLAEQAEAKQLILSHLPSDGDFALAQNIASQHFSGKITLASQQAEYNL